MSIRMIARDLYCLQKQVEILQNQIKAATPEKREELQDRLRKTSAERNRMRRILEGAKEPSASRKPR